MQQHNAAVDPASPFNMLVEKFNYVTINRESVNGKRHYCLPDGSKVASVTTILDATKSEESKTALNNWRKRVGAANAQNITTEAASRGTRLHKWLENYVKLGVIDKPGTNPYSQQSHAMANTIITQGFGNGVSEVWGMEVPLYYSGLYAGTTDCVALWRGKPAIIDFKQSNKPKKREWIGDYFLQLAAYSQAHNHMFNTEISCGVIFMCTPDCKYQEFVIEGEEFEHWKNLWFDRLEQYYTKY